MRKLFGCIIVKGTDQYEAAIAQIINKIVATKTGSAILHKISVHGDATIEQRDGNSLESETSDGRILTSHAKISFTPLDKATRVSLSGSELFKRTTVNEYMPGEDDDERLLHELVHAARLVGGDDTNAELHGSLSKYDNVEDYYAILVANIYMSEKGKTFLRGGHGAWDVLHTANSEAFLADHDNWKLIDQFCRTHPNIAPMIADAPATFNPIQAYYDQKKAATKTVAKVFLKWFSPANVPIPVKPAPAKTQEPAKTQQPARTQVTIPADLLFGLDKDALKPKAVDSLKQMAEMIKTSRISYIQIYGHTDALGNAMHNMDLSNRRAKNVAEWLITQGGVSSQKVQWIGVGKSHPIASNHTSEGRALNRRVEIQIGVVP